jgi:hypothetical protein
MTYKEIRRRVTFPFISKISLTFIITNHYHQMNKQRYKYSIIILLIIIAGLLSRQTKALPASTGDALYATMMYLL